MNNKLKIDIKKALAYEAVLFTALCSSQVVAEDYEVLGGSFFMSDGITPTTLPVGPDTGITTLFSDTAPAFNGDFNCTSTSSLADPVIPNPDPNCVSTNPDPTATNNGLDSFSFFGQPVYSYFAANGIDGVAHPAPTIDISGGGTTDFSSFYANWNGTEFNQGTGPGATSPNKSPTVTNNFDGTYTVAWTSLIVGGAFDGKIGDWTMTLRCLTCPDVEAGPSPTLSIVQATETTRTATNGDGDFTVSTDLVSTAGYNFDWSATDPAILAGQVSATDTLVIDPSAIAPGTYQISVTSSNGNELPNQSAQSSVIITIVSTGDLADIGDSDNDGVQNTLDAIDNTVTPTRQQFEPGNGGSFVLQSSAGTLVVGRTAACVRSNSASVTATNIQTSGGSGCTAPTNATDLLLTVQSGIGGYFDWEVRGLAQGASVDVVVPVTEPIPVNASFRIYNESTGWNPFVTATGDLIASAAGSPGSCPSPADSVWTNGLSAGHNCIRLSITDGGVNDTDGFNNGVVTDPGTVSFNPGVDVSSTTVGGGYGLLLWAPLFWLRRIFRRM